MIGCSRNRNVKTYSKKCDCPNCLTWRLWIVTREKLEAQ